MSPEIEALLARSFRSARARDANQEIAAVRAERGGGPRQPLSYEIILPEQEPVKHLLESVLPRLVYFLDCRGATLPEVGDVFATVFAGEALHFLDTAALLGELSRLSGLTFDQMVEKWGAQSV